MFAVDGWKLPNVVVQRPEKKRKLDKDVPRPSTSTSNKKSKLLPKGQDKPATSVAGAQAKSKKDKSQYMPYSKEKNKKNSGSNVVPVAAIRKPRSPTPPPEQVLAQEHKNKGTKSSGQQKKPLARPPRSERDATPPKLFPDLPPPSFSGLLSNTSALTPLQKKMAAKLSGARFRWINERLYTTTGADALRLMKEKPDMFDEYHAGFRSQVKEWPSNPIDIYKARLLQIVHDSSSSSFSSPTAATTSSSSGSSSSSASLKATKSRQKKPVVVLDLGCGDAMLAQELERADPSSTAVAITSYDLTSTDARVTTCDIAALPDADASADIAIFCLSLMGTDFLDFVAESARVLRTHGRLWVAEIKSRFNGDEGGVAAFVSALGKFGFELTHRDDSNRMFIGLDFVLAKRVRKGADGVGVGVGVGTGVGTGSKRRVGSGSGEAAAETRHDHKTRTKAHKVGTLLKPCTYKKR